MNSSETPLPSSKRPHFWPIPFQAQQLNVSLTLLTTLAIGLGAAAGIMGILIVGGWAGSSPPDGATAVEQGLAMAAGGICSLIAGIGMWKRRIWGWGLMVLVHCSLLGIAMGTNAFNWMCVMVWLIYLKPAFIDKHQCLEPDIDRIATARGIDWGDSPFGHMGKLVQSDQRAEAARIFRDLTGCRWDEATAAVANWQFERVAIKLRLLALAVEAESR
jgi:hypothetical protein